MNLGHGPTLRSGDSALCNEVSKQKMNPARRAPHKESEFDLNARFDDHLRIHTEHMPATRAKQAQLNGLRLVNHVRKGYESAGGHRQIRAISVTTENRHGLESRAQAA
jgi:hypothetical protein